MQVQDNDRETTRASLELLYHISRELAAALDLRTVLQRVLFLSMRNVDAISGSIIVLDDNGQAVESTIITGTQVHDQTTRQLRVTLEHGLAGWVAREGQAVLVSDTSLDDRWLRRPDDAEDKTGPKSAVSAPLMWRNQLVGVMTLVHPSPGFFTLDHMALVQAIADQASTAVLNARLYAESQRQASAMTAVAESAEVITASLRLDDVLNRILEQISQVLRVEAVSLALINPEEEKLEFQASTSGKRQGVVGMSLDLGQGIAGWVAQEGQGVIVPEARQDPRFYPDIDHKIGFETKAIACAPIRSEGAVIGILEALNPLDGAFDPGALKVLTGIGSLAGTAIRHAQLFEQLQAAHQRYLELFEDSIDPIIITDRNGLILEANRQAALTTEYSKDALPHLPIDKLHAIDYEIVGDGFKNVSAGSTISYESTLSTQSGSLLPVQVYVREVQIERVSHLQWILRDITERKDLDRLRDDLISMIYHDLRSPLANVVSSLDVLASLLPLDSDPAFKSLLSIAVRSTERIQRLTDSLLDMNRLEADQPIGNRQTVSPSSLASEAVDTILPIAQNKNQEFLLEVPPNLPPIYVDADMIKRVLTNLLENAVKYTPPEGKILVGAKVDGSSVQMWVQDNGPGIPQDQQDQIFQKYTRLQPDVGPKGIGLGLAYCRLAVEGHDGKIWIEGHQGAGTRFIFSIPIANELKSDDQEEP
jgi:PAS domain S-box-containing protein